MLTRGTLTTIGAGIRRSTMACALAASMLDGCGQKGPLVLAKPLPPAAPASSAAAAQ